MERVNLFTLIHDLRETNEFVALGDTSHLDESIIGLKYDLDLITTIGNAGFGSLVYERSPDSHAGDQAMTNSFESHPETDPEVFYKQRLEYGFSGASIAGPFASAAEGLNMIYPDPRYNPDFGQAIDKVYDVLRLSPTYECADVFLQSFWNSDPEASEVIKAGIYEGDETIAERIVEQSGGDGAFIVYGDGHFKGEHDLNEMLGEDKVAVVAAIGSREKGYNLKGNEGEIPDAPDYIYIVNEDAVIPFDADSPEVQQILSNYQSHNVDDLSPAEFEACAQKLPADLKPFVPTQNDGI